MGRVYEATQDHPSRTVALKIIGVLPSRDAPRRFRYECEILARLKHPGIAQIYEAFSAPDPLTGEELPCFAMEFLEGARTLLDFCSDGRLGILERVGMIIAASEALHHAHQRGVIHRDIKPGNLIVDRHGVLKVIDFGIARKVGEDVTLEGGVTRVLTRTGQLVGTPSYMSPEQCRGDSSDIGVPSDVYSLGVVLHELLAARLPYEIRTAAASEAARRICEDPPARLRTSAGGIVADLEAVSSRRWPRRRRTATPRWPSWRKISGISRPASR